MEQLFGLCLKSGSKEINAVPWLTISFLIIAGLQPVDNPLPQSGSSHQLNLCGNAFTGMLGCVSLRQFQTSSSWQWWWTRTVLPTVAHTPPSHRPLSLSYFMNTSSMTTVGPLRTSWRPQLSYPCGLPKYFLQIYFLWGILVSKHCYIGWHVFIIISGWPWWMLGIWRDELLGQTWWGWGQGRDSGKSMGYWGPFKGQIRCSSQPRPCVWSAAFCALDA